MTGILPQVDVPKAVELLGRALSEDAWVLASHGGRPLDPQVLIVSQPGEDGPDSIVVKVLDDNPALMSDDEAHLGTFRLTIERLPDVDGEFL